MEKVKILKAVDIINDSVSEYEGKRPFLSTGDLNLSTIKNLELHTFIEKPSRANQNVSAGDIVLARMQGTVKVKVIQKEDEGIIVSTGFLVLRPKSNADNKYLFHLLRSLNFQNDKDKLCSGATQKAINNSNFEKLVIPLPPLATQQKLATILDQADALIQNNRTIVQKYDALTQSLFLDMFGDPVKNEKGWDKKKLGDFGIWKSGGTPSRRIEKYFQGTIPWISSGELNEMYIDKAKEYITDEAVKNTSTHLIEKGSLLLGMYDTAALKSSINTVELTCNQAIAFAKLNENVNTLYVYYVIQYGKEHYKSQQRGVRQKNLNLSMIKDLKINYPPIELQNQFAERVAVIESQKQQAQLELAKSELLFQSLLQQAFKGELS